MIISKWHRERLEFYLSKFYKFYPEEKHTIFHFVKFLKLRINKKKDAWIGVSGETGGGKSLFTIMCLALFGRRPSRLDYNITYIPKGDEITEKFDRLNKNVLIIDEAAKQMRSVNWQDKKQQKVNVKAMTDRFKSNVVFLNMPNFDEFTKSMKKGSLIFRAILVYRTDKYARIIIQRKSRNWRSEDPWGDKLANSLYENVEKKLKKEVSNDVILSIERSIPNTVMDFIIPNLEMILPDITAEYERLKKKSREIDAQKDVKNVQHNVYKSKYQKILERAAKALYRNELNIGKLKTTKMSVAEALGISTQTLNQYLSIPDIIPPKFRRPSK